MVDKFRKLVALTQAIERARAEYVARPGVRTGLQLQRLVDQRNNLQATMRPQAVT
jgi:hypothetical protein